MKNKLIRITTVPISLEKLLENQLRFMKSHYEVTAISSDKFNLDRIGQLQEVSVFFVKMTRKITPITDLISVYKLYRLFKKERPLIVHSHTPKAGIVGMLGAKLAGVPLRLHTVAGLPLMEATGIKRKVLDFVEKLTYFCATKVYPNSKGLYDFILKNNYTSKDKLKVIAAGSSNGINTDFFSPEQLSQEQVLKLKTDLNLSESDFIFVFVGRLVGDKGINELVKAFKKTCLSLNSKSCKLLLVGPLESELDQLTIETLNEIESNPNITSVGYQQDVRPYFAISDSLVFPSYREGFPNVVMQAGAMGLPSIVTNINGCNEIIIEGENGTIVPVKNTEALYQSMYKMMMDDTFRSKLQQKARQMIVSRYEQKVVWEAILAEYKKLEENVL